MLAIILVLTLLSMAVPSIASAASPQGEASVFLEGPTEPVSPCSTFEIPVKLENVANLYGAEFHLSFDPGLLEVVDADSNPDNGIQIDLGPFLTGLSWPENPPEGWEGNWPPYETPYFIAVNSADNANGTVDFAFTLLNPTEPLSVSDAQALAIIAFHCKAQGSGQISFSAVKLVDSEGSPISISTPQPITVQQGVPVEKPDLVIKEIKCDRENNRVGYVVQNIGGDVAPAGHETTLWVNGSEVCHDRVDAELSPGETYEGWFGCYTWPEEEVIEIKVCADNANEVDETNEDNNCLEKTCGAPVTATATREIVHNVLPPGGETEVRVTIVNKVSQALSLDEDIPEGWSLTRVSDDADTYKPSTNEWLWFQVNAGVTKTVVYKLTVPADAAEGDYYLSGKISSAAGVIGEVGGENTMTVKETCLLTVNINPEGAGSVTLSPEQPEEGYVCGTQVTLTATPNLGYCFKGWSGDVPAGHENDNPLTIVMDSAKTITANFVDIMAYYRAYSGDPNVVDTMDLLKAADDWAKEISPAGCAKPIDTISLLKLANEWAAG